MTAAPRARTSAQTTSHDPHQGIELRGGNLRAQITPFGGYLTRLELADGRDVVLAHESAAARSFDDQHLGCVVGRCANRIRGGMFELDGWHLQLPCNSHDSHLHGGLTGFGSQVWEVVERDAATLLLRLRSPDGHENYPGNLVAEARFSISGSASSSASGDATLRLELDAVTDKATLCNLTWHPYFQLDGHGAGPIDEHRIMIEADSWLPMGNDHCPTGEVADVADTPFDLRTAHAMRRGLESKHAQIRLAEGFDHCFLIRGEGLRRAARVNSPDGQVAMEVWSTQPGLQFYTGNGLSLQRGGKDGASYRRREGFCLEAQGLPDAPNHRHFPSTILRPGERYRQIIEYRFEL